MFQNEKSMYLYEKVPKVCCKLRKEIRKLGLESRPVIPAMWQVERESGMF